MQIRPIRPAEVELARLLLQANDWGPRVPDPSASSFMINYRVEDLHALLAVLRAEGVSVEDRVEESEYGKFGWVIDPEGNKLELRQPPPGR